MDFAIWALIMIWLPMIWLRLGSILDVLKDIRDTLKKAVRNERMDQR